MILDNRSAEIRKENTEECEYYVVDLFLNDMLIESRVLKGKSIHYANDVAENWINGIIPA